MKKYIYLAMLVLCSGLVLAVNVTLNCDWYDNTCPNNTSGYLRMNNLSANFTNGHAQLMNDTGTNYSAVLCCNASTYDYLRDSGSNKAVFVRLANTTNSHIQAPNMTNYPHVAYFKTAASYTTCSYTESSCPTGYQCIYSMEGDGQNYTNAHIARCGYYPNQVCCRITENVTTGNTTEEPTSGGGGGGAYEPPECALGEVLFNGECVDMSDVNCTWSFDKNTYDINETVRFMFECPGYEGRYYTVEWMNANYTVFGTDSGLVGETNEVEWMFDDEIDGILRLKISDRIETKQPYEVTGGFDVKSTLDEAGLWLVAFVVLVIIGGYMVYMGIKIRKKKRRLK